MKLSGFIILLPFGITIALILYAGHEYRNIGLQAVTLKESQAEDNNVIIKQQAFSLFPVLFSKDGDAVCGDQYQPLQFRFP
jgi:hypothetical protein